jgi:hypothetical protein
MSLLHWVNFNVAKINGTHLVSMRSSITELGNMEDKFK